MLLLFLEASKLGFFKRCGNMASIMRFNEDGTRDFLDYGPAPENERDRGMPMRRIVSLLRMFRFPPLTVG